MSTSVDSSKNLNACFSNIECCLLPHPGLDVSGATGTAEIHGKVTKDFTEQTANFVARILKPENIVTKKWNGREVKSHLFAEYIISCISCLEHLSKEKHFDGSQTMLEAVVAAKNFQVQKSCYIMYCKEMEKNITEEFIPDGSLQVFHQGALTLSMEEFDKKSKLGGEAMRKTHRSDLISVIEREYKTFATDNRKKQIEAEKVAMTALQNSLHQYKEKMETATAEKKSLEKYHLEKLHKIHRDTVVADFSSKPIHAFFKKEYSKQLDYAITRFYDNIVNENKDKKRVEQAREQKEQEMLECQIALKKQYKKELQEETLQYIDEETLLTKDAELQMTLKKQLDQKAQIVLGSPCASEKHHESLAAMLERVLDKFKKANEVNKEYLMMKLELQRSETYVDYDKRIKKVEMLIDTSGQLFEET